MITTTYTCDNCARTVGVFRVSVCFDSVDEYTAPNYVKGHWCKGCVENLAIMRLGNETIQCVKVTSE
jgi:hypothetical protein